MNGDWIGQCNRVARVGKSVSRVLQAPSRPKGTAVCRVRIIKEPRYGVRYPRADNQLRAFARSIPLFLRPSPSPTTAARARALSLPAVKDRYVTTIPNEFNERGAIDKAGLAPLDCGLDVCASFSLPLDPALSVLS